MEVRYDSALPEDITPIVDMKIEMLLLLLDWNGDANVYLLPVVTEQVAMPDNFWSAGYHYYSCSEFRPELDENSRIKKDGVIKCHDESIPERATEYWLWNYDGKKSNDDAGWLADLINLEYEIVDLNNYINH